MRPCLPCQHLGKALWPVYVSKQSFISPVLSKHPFGLPQAIFAGTVIPPKKQLHLRFSIRALQNFIVRILVSEPVQILRINTTVLSFSSNHPEPSSEIPEIALEETRSVRGFTSGTGSTTGDFTIKPRLHSKFKPEHLSVSI